MNKKLLTLCVALGMATWSNAQNKDYDLRVLTFEDKDYKGSTNFAGVKNWSSLIDSKQNGGTLLYGPKGQGFDKQADAYLWNDDNNTFLSSILVNNWGAYCYWNGGEAVSNYGASDLAKYGDLNAQITVYNKGAKDLVRKGSGHDGSDNFLIHFGSAEPGSASESSLPLIAFSDGVERVIDHMYINNTTYFINVAKNGNASSSALGENDWVKILVTGFDSKGKATGTTEKYLAIGKNLSLDGNFISVDDWTKFDLSSLGKVASISLNVYGNTKNDYGFSLPAYVAIDDIAVRFPKATTDISSAERDAVIESITTVDGKRVNALQRGINIVRMSDGTVRKVFKK